MSIDTDKNSPAPINPDNKKDPSDQLQLLTELTASAILIIRDLKLLYANSAAETLTGFTKQELMGFNFVELFSGASKIQIREWGTNINRGKSPDTHGEYKIVTKKMDERWIDLTTSPVFFDNEQAVICTIFDITEFKRGELLQDAVYRIAISAYQSKGLDDLFSAVHKIIAEVMNADNFYIALYDEEQNILSFPYFVDVVDTPPKPSSLGKGLTEYILRTGKSQLVDLALHDQLCEQGEIELVGVPSPIWLGVPLLVESRVIGVMVVQSYSDPELYGEREKRILEFVSSQVAMAINRKRFEAAIKESEERYRRRVYELAALYDTGRDLATQQDLNTLLGKVAERITYLLKSQGCIIYLSDEGRNQIAEVVSTGRLGTRGTFLKIGEGLTGKVAQSLQPMVIDDYQSWTDRSSEFLPEIVTAVAVVPMKHANKLIGVVAVYETEKGDKKGLRKYTQAEVDLLAVFADTIAGAVNNVSLLIELNKDFLKFSCFIKPVWLPFKSIAFIQSHNKSWKPSNNL